MSNSLFLQENINLQHLNTFGIAVKARFYVQIKHKNQLLPLRKMIQQMNLPYFILGGGSNLLLTQDFNGLVIHMVLTGYHYSHQDKDSIYIYAAAGESWDNLVKWTLDQQWGGLENLIAIPGSVGAAPIQNIGAYGVEFKEVLHTVEYFNFHTESEMTLTREACHFSYRHSIFKEELFKQGIITGLTLALPKNWVPRLTYPELKQTFSENIIVTPQKIAQVIEQFRKKKLPNPAILGNAGSFFKNPVLSFTDYQNLSRQFSNIVAFNTSSDRIKISAAWLIETCGWKGKRVGDAGVATQHALVLVNYGQATGQEILDLAKAIQTDVFQKTHIQLEYEPYII